ncbi:MAG: M48 family metallopeptidase [Bacteroidota bacterium]
MRFTFLIYLIIILPITSQSGINYGIQEHTGIDTFSTAEKVALRAAIYQAIPPEWKGEVSDRSIMRYAHNGAISLTQLLESGRTYNNWPVADNYVNEILSLIKAAAGFSNHDNIKAYLLKSGVPNAFMTPTGAIFVTVGLLATVEDESNLAGVMAHELAHYVLHHNLEAFVKDVRGDFKPTIFFSAQKSYSRYSVDNELDADKLAGDYLLKAGYSYDGLLKTFELSKRLEDKQLLTDSYSYKVDEITHPSSEKRIAQLNENLTRLTRKYGQGKNALIDSLKLNEIGGTAKAEVLKLLLSGYAYQACIEKAFQYHIFSPNNATYVYYLMEAIRRMCYFNIDLWNESFIVDDYYEFNQGFGVGDKNRIRDNFFTKFRFRILELRESEYDNIEAKFYWEEAPRFTTYEQAFQYFFEIGKLLQEPECYLSNALSLSFDKEKMNFWLNKYLAFSTVRYPEYAKALLADKIHENLSDQTLVIFDNLVCFIKQGPDYVVLRNGVQDAFFKEEIGKIASPKQHIYLKDLVMEDNEDFSLFNQLEEYSLLTIVSKGQKVNLHAINPEYWLLFKRYNINKIEFINALYNDKIKGKYTKEVYLDIADSNIQDHLLKAEGKARSISVIVTSIMMKPNVIAKKQFIEMDIDLNKNEVGYDLLLEKIRKGLNSVK